MTAFQKPPVPPPPPPSPASWEDSEIKMAGMLVVSHKGVNHGFCFHLGCSGRNSHIFSCRDIFLGLRIIKKRRRSVLVQVD